MQKPPQLGAWAGEKFVFHPSDFLATHLSGHTWPSRPSWGPPFRTHRRLMPPGWSHVPGFVGAACRRGSPPVGRSCLLPRRLCGHRLSFPSLLSETWRKSLRAGRPVLEPGGREVRAASHLLGVLRRHGFSVPPQTPNQMLGSWPVSCDLRP